MKYTSATRPLITVLICITLILPIPVAASVQTLSVEDTSSTIYQLKAKVAYLSAWLEALRAGKRTPAPTFLVVLSGDTASVVGTLARDPESDRLEACGPAVKGVVDWGDGTSEDITGLGCAGDVHPFTIAHSYQRSDSFPIVISDMQERSKTHVIAVVTQ